MTNVKLTTSMGEIVIELDDEKAPITTANFLSYVDSGHYDHTIFHRVIPNFMIQGGGFTADLKQKKTGAGIENEWRNGLINKRGTIAMARTSDPNSATAQFFINVVDNDFLSQPRDGAGYAVFGRVTQGMDVVDKIKDVPTGVRNGMADVPVTPVTIVKAERI
jgi:cyclophilin family peptidyl-prolyl cis-trans isomerase